MGRNISITYIIDDMTIAGAQVHLVRLASGLSHEFTIEVISLDSISNELVSRLPSTIKLRSFQMSSTRKPYFYLSFIQLVSHLRRVKPDIVHTYLNTSNVFGLLAAKIAGVRHVVTSRRDMGVFQTGRMAKVEALLSNYLAQRVFCVCKAVARNVSKVGHIPESKIRVIVNGVDIEVFSQKTYQESDVLNFGLVATMNRVEKGHFDFIKASALMIHKYGKKANFWLIGDGPLKKGLESLVKELNLAGTVKFLGEQKELRPILEKLDVIVVPSYSEGISNAALEAMAVGLPVIGTAVDGNLELIEPDVTGILVPPGKPEMLAKAFLKYVSHPYLIKAHGINARKKVEDNFTIQKMIESYKREYYSLMAGRKQ